MNDDEELGCAEGLGNPEDEHDVSPLGLIGKSSSTATTYGPANRTAQWFGSRYVGTLMTPNCVVLHTAETTGWPGYSGGAVAPNLTYHSGLRQWRQHFPLNRSARALKNTSGGVQTNTANVIQVELTGTCDPAFKRKHPSAPYWPTPSASMIADLAAFLSWCHTTYGIPLSGPSSWKPYPASYGVTSERMSFAEWRAFRGICGHCHVPENVHGDPGSLPFTAIIAAAKGDRPKPPVPPTYLEQIMAVSEASLAKAIAAALLGSEVAPGVTVANALRRLEEDSIRSGLRDMYRGRIAAAVGRNDAADVLRALTNLEDTVFAGEGAAIGEPLTHRDDDVK